ncbi:Protein SPA, chloroplastic [Frankliniella fusca]|uniref:Protein SPA, chloroplastic n=1 Tax=Frankliniella fusca TaxID=407009 RepID=A0AAE1HM18_9NEOP|nr:Protein SPA, chloroplastic [Frankliniella fusca]
MSALLTQLDSHVLERKLRLCQAALTPGSGLPPLEEHVKQDLRHFAAAGSVTFDLSCQHCAGAGPATCSGCRGSGRRAPVVLDLGPYHPALDEAQLVARYLIMVVLKGDAGVALEAPEAKSAAAVDLGEAPSSEKLQLCAGAKVPDQPPRARVENVDPLDLLRGGDTDDGDDAENAEQRRRARYEQLEAEVVRREEAELAWRREHADGEEDDDDEDDSSSSSCDLFDSPAVLTVDVSSLSRYGPGQQTLARNALLAPALLRPVRKLTNVHCEYDPDWALQLLSDVSPRLEELQLRSPARRHLQVVERMRHLTRLDLEFYSDEEDAAADDDARTPPRRVAGDPVVADLGVGLDEYIFRRPAEGGGYRGLRWLRVGHLPKLTTFSLLRAHRHTLEEVWLMVGSWRPEQQQHKQEEDARCWPASCRDLHLQLSLGGATWPRLQDLVLVRWLNDHDGLTCLTQTLAVQAALPGVRVRCHECGGQPYKAF